MFLSLVWLIAGFYLLIKGGDWLISGSSALARRHGISELAIGLTVVAFGTSAPEMVVTILAAIDGHPEIALGNVIGSNNFNLFVILGISGIITPLAVNSGIIRKEIPMSLLAALLLLLLANNFGISGRIPMIDRFDALFLLACFGGFLLYVKKSMKQNRDSTSSEEVMMGQGKAILFVLLGLAGLIGGGKLVVSASVDLARMFHVSEKVIGLTIVAAGTSLPELVTSLVAIRRKSTDIAIGNVIGSNIFNIFFILGTGAVITPIIFNTVFNVDLMLLVAGTLLLLLAMFTGKKHRLDRWEAFILLGVYLVYMVYVALRN
ncbi:calcium/sodium antiporter [Alkaliflexus imshenetskii]|uniref:calcium/sodium antiporter n=1 Tax=Alkaliflexus imshenetskii TaxID=286730 RepID=UPI00047DBC9C|nr:calcium/sodium antiporter [Alkaliflexus imshenetskii]